MKFSLSESQAQLPLPATTKWPQGIWDIEIFRKGEVSLSLFTPKGQDYQSPHDQDELYIIHRGHGIFSKENGTFEFGPGDTIFVEAGKVHHFAQFSDDFVAWVVFF